MTGVISYCHLQGRGVHTLLILLLNPEDGTNALL